MLRDKRSQLASLRGWEKLIYFVKERFDSKTRLLQMSNYAQTW